MKDKNRKRFRPRRAKKLWKFRNTTLFVFSVSLFIYLASTPIVDDLIAKTGDFGYVGAFIAGFLSVSTFTVAPSVLVLFHLADKLHPLEVALLAGLGAMIGDYFVFNMTKDALYEEWRPILSRIRKSHKVRVIFKSPLFAWTVPVVGAIVIAFPLLPDEVGIGLLGMSDLSRWKFFLLSFGLNAIGVFIIVSAAQI